MPGDPSAAEWRVYLRDADGAILDELDNWISLELRMVFNNVGTWTLEMSSDGVSARYMDASRGIVVTRKSAAEDSLEVTIFSGRIFTEFTRTARTIRCAGLSDDYLLQQPALPDPGFPDAPTVPYNVITGAASSVMRAFVRNNIGDLATVARQTANLTIQADPVLGGSLTGRGGGQPLVALLRELAATEIAGGLGFSVIQTSITGTRTFRIYQPQDRSDDVKFGLELGTVSDFEDTKSAPEATYYYVMLGDGLGADGRTIIAGGDADAIAQWGRIERLHDAREITDTGEGEQKLAELLAGAISTRRTVVTPFEVPSQQFVDDWFLGDLVTFEVDTGAGGVETFVDLIREVRIDLTTDRGVVITPMIGDAAASGDSVTAQHIAAVEARIGNVERNWTVPDLSIIPDMLTDNAVIARTIAANAVTEPKLDVLDAPSNNDILTYDSGTGRLEWQTWTELSPATVTFAGLIVTGNTTLGDNVAADTLAVNAAATLNGTAVLNGATTAKANVTIQNSAFTTLALFDVTAGAQLIKLGNQTTPGLYVDVANARTIVGGVTPLGTAPDDKFAVVGGVSYFAGNSGPSIGLRYNASQTVGWTVGVSAAGANPSLAFKDDGGVESFTLNDASAGYQAQVTGNLYVSGVAVVTTAFSSGIVIINGTTQFGSEKLRVQSGTSRLEGAVTITTGDLSLTSGTINVGGNIDMQSGTAGQFRGGGVIINAASFSSSEKLRVGGSSRLEGSVTVTTGGIGVTGSSSFANAVSITSGGLTIQAGGIDVNSGLFAATSNAFGFFGAAVQTKQTITGVRTGTLGQLQTVVSNMLSALANHGIWTNSTT